MIQCNTGPDGVVNCQFDNSGRRTMDEFLNKSLRVPLPPLLRTTLSFP